MHQVLSRRLQHYTAGDNGFDQKPDVLLIDGGVVHARTALSVVQSLNLCIPVFGMVKDDRHRTRALVTPSGEEIRIDNQQAVFAFIGSIQEETHRFAISYHRKLRSKRLKYSELDNIPGVGSVRKQTLLRAFKSLKGISNAELFELEMYLPKDVALAVYTHFQKKQDMEDGSCV
jgi:excinuclease ABC subunit C